MFYYYSNSEPMVNPHRLFTCSLCFHTLPIKEKCIDVDICSISIEKCKNERGRAVSPEQRHFLFSGELHEKVMCANECIGVVHCGWCRDATFAFIGQLYSAMV
jgi:hypothetical protein